ncbi:hypothetical protein MNBD_GAMMA17-1653 [hydrothermal vent metagenome]|uniref:Excinuclease ATPase subunit n=1 Tax=hydrothermal vent metagenome TaxID=652676 RepID=A0A3B0ZRS0_9ZZZZ
MLMTRDRSLKKAGLFLLLLLIALFCVSDAFARNDQLTFPVQDVLNSEDAEERLGGRVKFYFGAQESGEIARNFGEYRSNKKTNAFNKSDLRACNWAFLSALIALEKRALREGGDAVINIQSNYKNNPFSSETEFECGAGNIIAGVALKGTVVKLKP